MELIWPLTTEKKATQTESWYTLLHTHPHTPGEHQQEMSSQSIFNIHHFHGDEVCVCFQEATEGRGIDVIVEMLSNVNLSRDIQMLAYGGRVAVSNNAGILAHHQQSSKTPHVSFSVKPGSDCRGFDPISGQGLGSGSWFSNTLQPRFSCNGG